MFVMGTYRQLKHTSEALKQWYKVLGKEFESFLTKFSAAYQCFFTSLPFEALGVQDSKIDKFHLTSQKTLQLLLHAFRLL